MTEVDSHLTNGNFVRANHEPPTGPQGDSNNSKANPSFQPHQNKEAEADEKGFLGTLKRCFLWISHPSGSQYLLGVILIVCVAVIWVASSMWIQYIFGDLNYNRPYFLTYFNTTLFSLYNLGYLFMPSWRNLHWKDNSHRAPSQEGSFSEAELTGSMQEHHKVHRDSIGSAMGVRVEMRDGNTRETDPTSSTTFNPLESTKNAPDAEARGAHTGVISSQNAVANNKMVNTRSESGLNPIVNSTGSHTLLHPSDGTEAVPVSEVRTVQKEVVEVLPPYSMYKIWHCATFFCFYWFAANYLYNLSLSFTNISSNAVLSSTSNIWTLLFSYLILHQRVGILKCLAVALCVGGSLFITLSDQKNSNSVKLSETTVGDILSLCSAFFYAVYTSVLSKCLPDDDRYSMFMVFGAVGAINLICFWPGIVALNSVGYEHFSFPNNAQFWSLLLNSLIGTNLSDILWARSVVLSSPVVATLGISLTSPFSMIADAVFHGKTFTAMYVCGALMVMIGFVLANIPKMKIGIFKRL